MKPIYRAPIVCLSAGLLVASLMQGIFFCRSLKAVNDLSMRRIAQVMGQVLEHAHRLNDDLTLQVGVLGFLRAPGILFAGVLDRDNKVLAHTQTSQLGKTFSRPRVPVAVLKAVSLQNAGEAWGKLVFSMSNRMERRLLAEQILFLMALNAGAIGPLLWLVSRWQAAAARQGEQAAMLEFQRDELQRDLERLRLRHTEAVARGSYWVQQALERIPQPMLFLDAAQRLTACNQAARACLGGNPDQWPIGASWQDVAALAGNGEALQRSLERPGEPVEGASLRFFSEAAHGGTWVFFR